MNNAQNEMLKTAQDLIRKTGKKLNLSQEEIDFLIQPDRVIEVKIPVKMDNGVIKSFIGFRSQHSNVLGSYKGGIRFHPTVSREEVIALSILMTLKCAANNLPLGGGKGGVIVNSEELSEGELEKLSRGYAKAIAPFIGEEIDIPAPDVNTDSKIMLWMLDEYEKTIGRKSPATFTGKPVEAGGSLGRTEATGRGGVIVMENLLKNLNKDYKTIAVQGFGNVGYYFSKIAFEKNYKIVAISDSKGGIYNENGLNPEEVMKIKKETNKVTDFKKGKIISNEKLLELKVDILVPAALENVISQKNANKIKAKVIIEMANSPVTEETYPILEKREIKIVPDILANAGGVIVSYFEWLQNKKNEKWSEEKVNQKLEEKLKESFKEIFEVSSDFKTNLKEAAFISALLKITKKI
ncbi:MAG TPA: Glu/Leu/Phe/Val dehydrogenase [Candidatus Pacearchaeota archaeon]|mgnify:FL=1|nr:Glu/Leu/Phe/Val dehydrogenase [Candidatus Pacearchaeota archaeon]